MKNRKILAILALILFFTRNAWANENTTCPGLMEVIGASINFFQDSPNEQFSLRTMTGGNPMAEYDTDSNPQTVTMPDPDPSHNGANVITGLGYDGTRLNEAYWRTMDKDHPTILSKHFIYDWMNGHCRVKRITVSDERAYPKKTGILFDAGLCTFLKGQKDFDLNQVNSCAKSIDQAFQKIQAYADRLQEASKDKEFLVSSDIYTGAWFPFKKDSSSTLSLLAMCAEYNKAAQSPDAGDSAAGKKPGLVAPK